MLLAQHVLQGYSLKGNRGNADCGAGGIGIAASEPMNCSGHGSWTSKARQTSLRAARARARLPP